MADAMSGVKRILPQQWDLFTVLLTAFLAMVALDVVGLFVGEVLHLKALMTGALAVFVWIQVGMTVASLCSFPATLYRIVATRARRRGTARAAR